MVEKAYSRISKHQSPVILFYTGSGSALQCLRRKDLVSLVDKLIFFYIFIFFRHFIHAQTGIILVEQCAFMFSTTIS
jgi:hypothetical protein